MRTIYKFKVEGELTTLQLEKEARILCVQMQGGIPQVWVELDTSKKTYPRRLLVFGTGWAMPDNIPLRYIGTIQMYNAMEIYHVYEEILKTS